MKTKIKVLWGIRAGNEDWQEELLSEGDPSNFEKIKAMAERDGFDRFRVALIDLTLPPDFAKVVR